MYHCGWGWGGCTCLGAVLSPQFCHKPKTALRKENLLKSLAGSWESNKVRDGSYCSTKLHIKES